MNQLLGSRLEALAFNYVSFGIFTVVNNLWTWVAVVTAAVSFWSIRAAGSANLSCSVSKTAGQKPSSCIVEAEEKPSRLALVSAPLSVAETSSSTVSPLVCDDGVTKGGKFKLTVCYEDDGDSDVDGETTVTEWSDGTDGDCKEGSCGGEWWESWKRVLRMRKGETGGWYRYQDLTAINGNVVRLWEESCR